MADEKLVEEVAQRLAAHYGTSGGTGYSLARLVLADTALIKRMAEGVGFEVKEKPLRYEVVEHFDAFYVKDRGEYLCGDQRARISKWPDEELARRHIHEIADELNQKERAADGK